MIFTVEQNHLWLSCTENKNDFQVCFCSLRACQMSKALEKVLKISMKWKNTTFKWHVDKTAACSVVLVRHRVGLFQKNRSCAKDEGYIQSCNLNMKGIVVALSQAHKYDCRGVVLMRNLEIKCNTEICALNSGFFLPYKGSQCFSNSTDSL